jgi:Uma2 family endonuclease
MSSAARVDKTITLDEFLRMPEIDEHPYLEYIDGRIEASWLIDPGRKTVSVYRPGRGTERLAADGALRGDPVLVGHRLPIAELFGWLTLRSPKSPPPSQPGPTVTGESTR